MRPSLLCSTLILPHRRRRPRMAVARFPIFHASSPLPPPSPPPSSSIPPLSSLPVLFFSILAVLLRIAAAVKGAPPYPVISSTYDLVDRRYFRIRLRLDPLSRIAASYPEYLDPPLVSGLDPPELSRSAHPLDLLLWLFAWSEPNLVLRFVNLPKTMASGEILDPSRSREPAVSPSQAALQRRPMSSSRAIQVSRPRGNRTKPGRKNPDQAKLSRSEGSRAEPQAKNQLADFQQLLVDEGMQPFVRHQE